MPTGLGESVEANDHEFKDNMLYLFIKTEKDSVTTFKQVAIFPVSQIVYIMIEDKE